jgi:hypothetical protein
MLSVYTLLTVGMQLHLHHCCGELSDLHFFASKECLQEPEGEDDHCCKKGNCCSFIHIDLKIDDSHQPSEPERFAPPVICEPTRCIAPIIIEETCQSASISEDHSPPLNSKRYLLFHSLVLYA